MDLVSFDTPGEFKMFEEIMARGDGEGGKLYLPLGSITGSLHVTNVL